jgi:hypothetical protein
VTYILDDNDEAEVVSVWPETLAHIGVLRKSGRYPWGSGETPNQRNRDFLATVDKLKKQGLTDVQIARGLGLTDADGITTTELRALRTIAKAEQKQSNITKAQMLKDKGLSNVAIGQRFDPPLNESSVRSLLDPRSKDKADELEGISARLKQEVDEKRVIDIGAGVEAHLGIAPDKLGVAVAMLQEEGYLKYWVKEKQLGTGKETTIKVLAKPDVTYPEIMKDRSIIKNINMYSPDGGKTMVDILPPTRVDLKRVGIKWAEDGGADMDGVIELRRGVDDISLGNSKYAQVRIAVGPGHYLKGMAIYADDLPDGVDMRFNTNKGRSENKLDALKPLKTKSKTDDTIDEENAFGAVIRQRHYTDKNGKEKLSPINIVNEEGDWNKWSKNLSSQALSKQRPSVAKQQLGLKLQQKQAEYEEIMALTNPTIRKKMLESFSDDLDSSAVHLKAAALPRQKTQVILPINAMKDNEVYAPQFRQGESVVLIRYPHGGIFEIPHLIVNNNVPAAAKVMKQAKDAVGINARVAERLSGADFDGDTVLVIPNDKGQIRTSPALKELKGFDPKKEYKAYPGMPPMAAKTKQLKMGDVSNLITDMTVRGAPNSEIARAVRHSMVVIDAEKHNLNWKQSAKDHGIAELKKKYQEEPSGGKSKGAATLISRASSDVDVPLRKPRSAANGGPIDIRTGKKVYEYTGESYIQTKTSKRTGAISEKVVVKTEKSKQMTEVDDAYSLSSGTKMESVYADHANALKNMANRARLDIHSTPNLKYSKSAKVVYSGQVDTLKAKLNIALRNKPLERQAQLIANAQVYLKKQDDPGMDPADLKKLKGKELTKARLRTGANKQRIIPTPEEWEAIQAGAISDSFLKQILANTDMDKIKELATPRERTSMTPIQVSRAKAMLNNGYDQAEISQMLGVPTSTLNDAIG